MHRLAKAKPSFDARSKGMAKRRSQRKGKAQLCIAKQSNGCAWGSYGKARLRRHGKGNAR